MAEDSTHVHLEQEENYRFRVSFDDPAIPVLMVDESPPVGGGTGPSPGQLLGTAVANCLAASLLFALRKFKNAPDPVSADVVVHFARNEANRLRIGGVDVELHIGRPAGDLKMLERVLAQFEDFCVITQSVRQGLPVLVTVKDADGTVLQVPEN